MSRRARISVERVDGADGGGAQGNDNCSHVPFAQLGFERIEVHAAAIVGGYGGVVELEDGGDALVRVVGLFGSEDSGPARP